LAFRRLRQSDRPADSHRRFRELIKNLEEHSSFARQITLWRRAVLAGANDEISGSRLSLDLDEDLVNIRLAVGHADDLG
jgi:hypothetical protein